jgi:hypothetical protein
MLYDCIIVILTTIITISCSSGFGTSAHVSPPAAYVCLLLSLIFFLDFKAHQVYANPASPAGIFPISVVLSQCFAATFNLCVSTEDCTHCPCASLDAEPGPSVMYTRVVPRLGTRWHRLSNGRVAICLVVPSGRVTANWGLRCIQPQVH